MKNKLEEMRKTGRNWKKLENTEKLEEKTQKKAKAISADFLDSNLKNKLEETGKKN